MTVGGGGSGGGATGTGGSGSGPRGPMVEGRTEATEGRGEGGGIGGRAPGTGDTVSGDTGSREGCGVSGAGEETGVGGREAYRDGRLNRGRDLTPTPTPYPVTEDSSEDDGAPGRSPDRLWGSVGGTRVSP